MIAPPQSLLGLLPFFFGRGWTVRIYRRTDRLLADLGLAHRPRPDHAAYLAAWLKVLSEDPRAIFTAASKAQQAADWMHARQPRTPPPCDAASALPAAA